MGRLEARTVSLRIPSYRRYPRKCGTDLACVEIPAGVHHKGKRFYLGAYGSAPSRERYSWLIGESIKSGCRILPAPTWQSHAAVVPAVRLFVSSARVGACYVRHLRRTKRQPDGRIKDRHNVRAALHLLRAVLPHHNMLDLSSHELDQVQAAAGQRHWAIATVRDRIRHIRLAIRSAVKANLLPVLTLQHLLLAERVSLSTPGIKPARRVPPVPESVIDETLPHLNRHIAAIVRLLRLTGARPSEIIALRPLDIDMSNGRTWLYRPAHHKTAHRGKVRTIYFGPAAQEVLAPFVIGRRLDAHVFDPREAEADRRQKLHALRKTPLNAGNSPGTNVKTTPRVSIGHRYKVAILRRAIHRVCEANGIERWNIYQVRHTAATRIRREAGLESAALALSLRRLELRDVGIDAYE